MSDRTLVIGGGIAGLSIAREIRKRGGDALVLEASSRSGGYVHTENVGGALVELGPQGFLGESPGVLDVIDELGLRDELLPADEVARKRYVFHRGRLIALPMSPPAFLGTPLLSFRAKLRVLAEPWAKPAPKTVESIRAFATRRIGSEAADVLVDAAVTGIFAGDPARLSVDCCFPKMTAMEREYGGLFRALRAKSKEGKGAFGKRLHSFRGGMEVLTRATAAQLDGKVRINAPFVGVERRGDAYAVRLEGGQTLEAPSVVLAVPAPNGARLLHESAPRLAALLEEIRSAPVAVIGLVFPRERVEHPLDGYGFLVPGGRFPILGCLFESSVFPGRTPEGSVLLRVMVGGARNPEAALRPRDAILASVLETIRPILGIRGEPEVTRIVVHREAIAQYDLGHPERLRKIEDELKAWPGLHLAGASYRGVSVNHLVGEAGSIAERVLGRG